MKCGRDTWTYELLPKGLTHLETTFEVFVIHRQAVAYRLDEIAKSAKAIQLL